MSYVFDSMQTRCLLVSFSYKNLTDFGLTGSDSLQENDWNGLEKSVLDTQHTTKIHSETNSVFPLKVKEGNSDMMMIINIIKNNNIGSRLIIVLFQVDACVVTAFHFYLITRHITLFVLKNIKLVP